MKGKVGSHEVEFSSVPRGPSGSVHLRVGGERIEAHWRRDDDGLWLELRDQVIGFDVDGIPGDDGTLLFGVTQRLRGEGRWEGLSFVRVGEERAAAGGSAQKRRTRVRAQMPGRIVRVLVRQGQAVEKGQPLLVMEAMKMENEIRAPQAGAVANVAVSEGQAVESGADLIGLE